MRAEERPGEQVADVPVSDKALERQPFHGVHQAGIVTPRLAGMIAAFDVFANTPHEVSLWRCLWSLPRW
jgi:deferrochelatase/peroxidase EfeB